MSVIPYAENAKRTLNLINIQSEAPRRYGAYQRGVMFMTFRFILF